MPDEVPRITSLPSGQITSIEWEPPSMRYEPSDSTRTFAPCASIAGPGPVRTTIDPLRIAIVNRAGAELGGSSIGAECKCAVRSSDVTSVTGHRCTGCE